MQVNVNSNVNMDQAKLSDAANEAEGPSYPQRAGAFGNSVKDLRTDEANGTLTLNMLQGLKKSVAVITTDDAGTNAFMKGEGFRQMANDPSQLALVKTKSQVKEGKTIIKSVFPYEPKPLSQELNDSLKNSIIWVKNDSRAPQVSFENGIVTKGAIHVFVTFDIRVKPENIDHDKSYSLSELKAIEDPEAIPVPVWVAGLEKTNTTGNDPQLSPFGGSYDDGDINLRGTAIRETQEEIHYHLTDKANIQTNESVKTAYVALGGAPEEGYDLAVKAADRYGKGVASVSDKPLTGEQIEAEFGGAVRETEARSQEANAEMSTVRFVFPESGTKWEPVKNEDGSKTTFPLERSSDAYELISKFKGDAMVTELDEKIEGVVSQHAETFSTLLSSENSERPSLNGKLLKLSNELNELKIEKEGKAPKSPLYYMGVK